MKLRYLIPIIATLMTANNALAAHALESQALRKVIGASEVAGLNTFSPDIPQITRYLVEEAISILERGDNQPGYGVMLGTYTTPSWFDNREADADFTLPWGLYPRSFSFVVESRIYVNYILIFGRNGEELYRENINRFLTTSTLNFTLPNFVDPARISIVRLHNIARRGTRITAYANNGQPGNGDESQVLAILNEVRAALINYNPDMYFVRTRLEYAERLLRQ